MSTMFSFPHTTRRPMSVRTKLIVGATIALFAVVHVYGAAIMMRVADRSAADSTVVLRGD